MDGAPTSGVSSAIRRNGDFLESGWKSISKVFVLTFALDVVYQFMEWHGLKPLQALIRAIVLAVIPYAILRGPVNRVIQMSRTRRSVAP